MKIRTCFSLVALALCGALFCATVSGCASTPTTQNVAAQTLKATGHIAEAAVSTAGQLYRDKVITDAQMRSVIEFYDARFQPAFRVALAAVEGNASAVAPGDVAALAAELAGLVANLQRRG